MRSRRNLRVRAVLLSVTTGLALTGTAAAAAPPTTCGPFPPRHAYAAQVSPGGVVQWTTELPLDQGGLVDGSQQPLVDGSTDYMAQDGYVVALDAADGHPLWQAKSGDIYGLWRHDDVVAVLADQVSDHATVTGYDAATGAVRWLYRIPRDGLYNTIEQTRSGTAIAWITEEGAVQVLDLTTGRLRWSVTVAKNELQLQLYGAVVTTAGRAVLFAGRASLTAYDEHTGKRLWQVAKLPEQPQVTVSGGVVAIGGVTQGQNPVARVVGLALGTGHQLWQRRFPTTYALGLTGSPAGILVTGGAYPQFREYQLAPATGKTRWSAPAQLLPQGIGMSQTIVGDDLVQVTFTYDLYRKYTLLDRDLRTGHLRWKVGLHAGAARVARVVASSAQVYLLAEPQGAPGNKGEIYTYGLTTGHLAWTLVTQTALWSPPAVGPAGLLLPEVDPAYSCPV